MIFTCLPLSDLSFYRGSLTQVQGIDRKLDVLFVEFGQAGEQMCLFMGWPCGKNERFCVAPGRR